MKLTELLAKGIQAITATSTLIGMGMLSEKLDCTEVNSYPLNNWGKELFRHPGQTKKIENRFFPNNSC